MAYDAALDRRDLPVARTAVRCIGLADLRIALARGWDDFSANRTDTIFLCVLYPVVGLLLGRAIAGGSLLPLLFPLVAGFALVGPMAGLGLYEISRRRERGEPVTWRDAFKVASSPNIGAIVLIGAALAVIFVLWLQAAQAVFQFTMGSAPEEPVAFLREVLTTPSGWALIVVGHAVGFLFALFVLTVTVVSLPLLLDRDLPGGAAAKASYAVSVSVAAVMRNPVAMLGWGLIVAVGLIAGSLPFFIGLAVVLPVLGHATWHLYRRTVAPS